jgi:hypothetical protein
LLTPGLGLAVTIISSSVAVAAYADYQKLCHTLRYEPGVVCITPKSLYRVASLRHESFLPPARAACGGLAVQ